MPPAIDNNKKQTDCAENKKNCPNTTTTTTNNGVIKVSMVGEIAMSNFHNHQCKQSACFYIVCMHNGLKLFLIKLENILKGGLDLIPQPSPSMKIQIVVEKV